MKREEGEGRGGMERKEGEGRGGMERKEGEGSKWRSDWKLDGFSCTTSPNLGLNLRSGISHHQYACFPEGTSSTCLRQLEMVYESHLNPRGCASTSICM